MKYAELTKRVAQQSGISVSLAQQVLGETVETIKGQLAIGDSVAIPGLGTFSGNQKAARQARNPRTGEPIHVAARVAPKFAPAGALRDALN